jgi:hypothetical protein
MRFSDLLTHAARGCQLRPSAHLLASRRYDRRNNIHVRDRGRRTRVDLVLDGRSQAERTLAPGAKVDHVPIIPQETFGMLNGLIGKQRRVHGVRPGEQLRRHRIGTRTGAGRRLAPPGHLHGSTSVRTSQKSLGPQRTGYRAENSAQLASMAPQASAGTSPGRVPGRRCRAGGREAGRHIHVP